MDRKEVIRMMRDLWYWLWDNLFHQDFPDLPEEEEQSINCPVLVEIDSTGHKTLQKGW